MSIFTLFLGVALVCLVSAVVLFWKKNLFFGIVSLVITLFFLLLSGLAIHTSGHGTLTSVTVVGAYPLEENEIYEVVNSMSLEYKEGYAVIIRNREGRVKIYKFKEVPPSVFKVVEDDGGKLVYKAFP